LAPALKDDSEARQYIAVRKSQGFALAIALLQCIEFLDAFTNRFSNSFSTQARYQALPYY